MERAHDEVLPSALFSQPPLIRFDPQPSLCSCQSPLRVLKSREKEVFSLTGSFIAHETVRHCPSCSKIFPAEGLMRIVQPRCQVAYDVLVYVGRALFLRHRSTKEVRRELAERSVSLSGSEIDYLGRKFISFLAVAHRQATPRIRNHMTRAGGYVLHLDALHGGDGQALMTGLDGLSQIVLANVKIPGERSSLLIPFLRDLQETYGTPAACVHDMGKGLCKAVREVFPRTPDFICHFHFLRDLGNDYLDPAYRTLRNRLRHHTASSRLSALVREAKACLSEQGIPMAPLAKSMTQAHPPNDSPLLFLASVYTLALWAYRGKHSGDGYGFPFDRPLLLFAERLLALHEHLPTVLHLHPGPDGMAKPLLCKLETILSELVDDVSLQQAVRELRWRTGVFDRLRKAMRIAPVGGGNGLNDEGSAEAMSTIEQRVSRFRLDLDQKPKLAKDDRSRKMAEQIDKYGRKLFADPIRIQTPNGPISLYPQRTNNILEQFFRGLRRDHRRKTGNNTMSRYLRAMLTDTPLVKNLDNPAYMEILLNGKGSLEDLFADIGRSNPFEEMPDPADSDRILPGFRALIKRPKLPEHIMALITKVRHGKKSN